jgi:hypothetical protein
VLGAIGLSGDIVTNPVEKSLAITGVWSIVGSLLTSCDTDEIPESGEQ